jgi:hypothetical protein
LKQRDLDRFLKGGGWGALRRGGWGALRRRGWGLGLREGWGLGVLGFSSSAWELDPSDWELLRVFGRRPRVGLWSGGSAEGVLKTFLKNGDVGWKKMFL